MSDIFWQNFLTTLPATLISLGTLIGIIFANVLAARAASKVEQVRETLVDTREATNVNHAENARSLEALKKVAKETHILVNNKMAIQLRMTAGALRRIADMTKDPEDEKAALIADAAYREHLGKQLVVDAGQQ